MLTLQHLASLLLDHGEAFNAPVADFTIGTPPIHFNSAPRLMGVINLSRDSWYRESICNSTGEAIARGRELHSHGAALVDVGAESTLAHAARAGVTGQIDLLVPVVQGLTTAGVPVSIETYEPEVAEACLKAGASLLNLTGTGQRDAHFQLVSRYRAAVILNHVRGNHVREVGDFDLQDDPIPMMEEYFRDQIGAARRHGVEKLFLDPGLGFYYPNLQDNAERVRHQMKTFINTFRLRKLGYPVCHALPHAPEYFKEEVRSAEPFFAVLAALGQTSLFRTHEVARVRAVLDTLAAY